MRLTDHRRRRALHLLDAGAELLKQASQFVRDSIITKDMITRFGENY